MRWLVGLLAGLLAGCASIAPVAVPPQLNATPGPPAIITRDSFQNDAFSAWYPAGWRVVTSASFVAPHVVFISPCERAVIGLATDGDDIAAILPPALRADDTPRHRRDDIGGIVILLAATSGAFDTYTPVFMRMRDSVLPHDADAP
ncbi:MAG: hypothetical protein EA396_07610 [Anaerolineaceae bacterium]|nr:MAG: hypothetical protein EA396_07610 [Anaerolineaceae bacterium]